MTRPCPLRYAAIVFLPSGAQILLPPGSLDGGLWLPLQADPAVRGVRERREPVPRWGRDAPLLPIGVSGAGLEQSLSIQGANNS